MTEATRRPVEAFDTLMYRTEDDPRSRATLVGAFVLDRTPDWHVLLECLERMTREVISLRQKVIEPLLPVGSPMWVVDPDFDISYHVRRVSVPAPGTQQQLLDFLEPLTMSPLDKTRPLWELTLVEGLEGGQAAWVMKMNHAVADGVGGQAIVTSVFDLERDAPSREMPPKPIPDDLTVGELTKQGLRQAPISAAGTAVRAVRGASSALGGLARRPRETVTGVDAYVRSLGRAMAGPDAEPSPIMRGRSLRRRLLVLEVPKGELRAASRAAGGTLNDGLLAAVSAGMRLYHDRFGVPISAVPIAIPISTRRADDPEGGNRWAAARIALPVDEVDPAVRIQFFHEQVRAARQERALDAMSVMAPIAVKLPAWLLAVAFGGTGAGHDLQVSNIPSSPVPVFLAGAQVVKMLGFGPLPGPAAMITVNTYLDTCFVGINLDPAAITEPELFATCLEEGFAEVLALNA